MHDFKWIAWNLAKITKHGLAVADVEHVANRAARPYPQRVDGDKFKVWGQTLAGTYVQVVFVIEPDDRTFVIHARQLTDREKRRYRRRK